MKNSNKIDWKNYDRDVLIYMFRYCLSRKSYAVGTATDIIHANWNNINIPDRKLIHKEIKEYFELHSSAEKYDMDRTVWEVILELPIEKKGELL